MSLSLATKDETRHGKLQVVEFNGEFFDTEINQKQRSNLISNLVILLVGIGPHQHKEYVNSTKPKYLLQKQERK